MGRGLVDAAGQRADPLEDLPLPLRGKDSAVQRAARHRGEDHRPQCLVGGDQPGAAAPSSRAHVRSPRTSRPWNRSFWCTFTYQVPPWTPWTRHTRLSSRAHDVSVHCVIRPTACSANFTTAASGRAVDVWPVTSGTRRSRSAPGSKAMLSPGSWKCTARRAPHGVGVQARTAVRHHLGGQGVKGCPVHRVADVRLRDPGLALPPPDLEEVPGTGGTSGATVVHGHGGPHVGLVDDDPGLLPRLADQGGDHVLMRTVQMPRRQVPQAAAYTCPARRDNRT